jgi:hypothetical protein
VATAQGRKPKRTPKRKEALKKKVVRKSAKKSKIKPSKRTTSRRAKTAPGAGPKYVERLVETRGTVTEDLRIFRFAGVSLGGGKTDKTAVAILEFYPDKKRVFLRSLREKISTSGEVSADEALVRILSEEEKNLTSIAFDVPLQVPKCFRCELKCPGVEKCSEPEVKWMRDMHKKRAKQKRPNKMFTPYTERPAEIYISHELEEPFHPSHALGSNAAPLTARARFLSRRLRSPMIEVYPKLSLWRIGTDLDIPKSYLRFHRHAVDSDEARLFILRTLIDKEIAFIYQQDLREMVENNVAFEAFICALTAFLRYRGQTEKCPASFPKGEAWIEFPNKEIQWF